MIWLGSRAIGIGGSAVLMTAMLLSGCATTKTLIGEARPAPAERHYAFQTCPVADCASVTVVRDQGLMAGGCFLSLSAARQPGPGQDVATTRQLAARLDTGEVVTLQLEPGEWLLRMGGDPQGRGLCGPGALRNLVGENSHEIETVLQPRQAKRFRMRLNGDGVMGIERTD